MFRSAEGPGTTTNFGPIQSPPMEYLGLWIILAVVGRSFIGTKAHLSHGDGRDFWWVLADHERGPRGPPFLAAGFGRTVRREERQKRSGPTPAEQWPGRTKKLWRGPLVRPIFRTSVAGFCRPPRPCSLREPSPPTNTRNGVVTARGRQAARAVKSGCGIRFASKALLS